MTMAEQWDEERDVVVIGSGFGGNGFEGDFRAHARHVPQRNANPAGHNRQGLGPLNTRCGYW